MWLFAGLEVHWDNALATRREYPPFCYAASNLPDLTTLVLRRCALQTDSCQTVLPRSHRIIKLNFVEVPHPSQDPQISDMDLEIVGQQTARGFHTWTPTGHAPAQKTILQIDTKHDWFDRGLCQGVGQGGNRCLSPGTTSTLTAPLPGRSPANHLRDGSPCFEEIGRDASEDAATCWLDTKGGCRSKTNKQPQPGKEASIKLLHKCCFWPKRTAKGSSYSQGSLLITVVDDSLWLSSTHSDELLDASLIILQSWSWGEQHASATKQTEKKTFRLIWPACFSLWDAKIVQKVAERKPFVIGRPENINKPLCPSLSLASGRVVCWRLSWCC